MSTQRIHISIAFGDAILPLIDCEDGHQRVPLKPIADQVGVDWKGQKRRLLNDDYLVERFGLISGEEFFPRLAQFGFRKGQHMIRVDRVTAFLNTLNPRQIASLGNREAAEWLKSKHREWDDALHAYESDSVAYKKDASNNRNDLIRLLKARNKDLTPGQRAALDDAIADAFAEIGHPISEPQQALPL